MYIFAAVMYINVSDIVHADFLARMDEAIASRHMGRMPRPAPPGQGGRGLHPISPPGFIARSDAGSSQIDPPADEPPSLSRRDGPVDEVGCVR